MTTKVLGGITMFLLFNVAVMLGILAMSNFMGIMRIACLIGVICCCYGFCEVERIMREGD